MLLLRKGVSLALLFVMFLSFFAVLVGEAIHDGQESPVTTQVEGIRDPVVYQRGTRADTPQVGTTIPEPDSIDILVNTSILINFTNSMDTYSTEDAFSYTDGFQTWDIDNGTAFWTNSDKNLTFIPDSALDFNVEYTITIGFWAHGSGGEPFDGDGDGTGGEVDEDNYTWSFTTILSSPRIDSTSPSDGSTMVLVDTNVIVNFTKSMDRTSTEESFNYTDGVTEWQVSSGSVIWNDSDKTMTFTPSVDFENDKTYSFTIEHTAMDTENMGLDGDEDGVGGEGAEDDYSWSFTTIPKPPEILSTNPQDGVQNVNVDSNIVVTFSKTMDRTSVENAFNYTDSTTVWHASDGAVTWTNNDKTFTFTPSSEFDTGVEYEVMIAHTAMDSVGILLDVDGDEIPGEEGEDDFVWSFKTIILPPQINSTFPVHGSTLIPINTDIIINFTKSMDRISTEESFSFTDGVLEFGTDYGTVTWSNNDKTMTFDLSGKLGTEKTYTVTIKHTAKDAQGGEFDGDKDGIGGEGDQDDYTWSFTTMPEPPQVISVNPRDRSNMVEVDSIIEVRFTNSMNRTSVEDAFFYFYEGSLIWWSSWWGNVSWNIDSKVMTFELPSGLLHDREYTFKIEATARDEEGITLDANRDRIPEGVGIDDYIWSFTTIKEPPKVEFTSPENNSENVAIDENIVIMFDRAMNKGSTEKAFSYIYEGAVEEFKTSSGTVIWTDGNKNLTFNPDRDLLEGTRYTVTIKNTATDQDGISFEGFEFHFTTKANSPPYFLTIAVAFDKENTIFTALYADEDNDEPTSFEVVIDDIGWDMYESDPTVKDFTYGKMYEYSIELEPGEHRYYIEVSDGKNVVRYPENEDYSTFKVPEFKEEDGKFASFLEKEYLGISTPICGTVGIIILIAIIFSVILIARRRRAAEEEPTTFAAFETFEEAESPITFMPEGEEEIMTFASFEETAPFEEMPPIVTQCPECNSFLKVKAAIRPFRFPCKCGAKLILR